MKGPHSQETKAKMAEAHRRRWADPGARARMMEGIQAAIARRPGPKARPLLTARSLLTPQERSEAARRGWARRAVRAASLPLLKAVVDRAHAQLRDGEPFADVVASLRLEFRERAA